MHEYDDSNITPAVLYTHIKTLAKDLAEIKVELRESRKEHSDFYVMRETYKSDLKRTHKRINEECVSKEEFEAIKKPIWVIAIAIVAALASWIIQIIEKLPDAIQNAPL